MSLTKLSLAGNNKIIPAKGDLVGDILAGDGNVANLFLRCGRNLREFKPQSYLLSRRDRRAEQLVTAQKEKILDKAFSKFTACPLALR
jgi:hypothetical protein